MTAPDDAPAVWRSRWIVTQDGGVDLPYGRSEYIAADDKDKRTLSQMLPERFPGERMAARLRDLLISEEMNTRKAQDFTLYEDDDVVIIANTNASAGYCYVEAWLKPNDKDKEAPSGRNE
jgi:hypothetical protein